jgi:hypothetical protein
MLEAALVLDVYNVSVGFADPGMSLMRDDIIGYVETVVRVEWPAQAKGLTVDRGTAYLKKLNSLAIGLKPSSVADGNLQALVVAIPHAAMGRETGEIAGCRDPPFQRSSG